MSWEKQMSTAYRRGPKHPVYGDAERFEQRMVRGCELANPPSWIENSTRYLDGHSLTKFNVEYDSQRQTFYDAQHAVGLGRQDFSSQAEFQKYVNNLTTYRWWERRFLPKWCGEHAIRVEVKRKDASSSHAKRGRGTIHLSPTAHERTVIHEVAHIVTPKPHAGHGRLYARVFLELIDWRWGSEAADKLKEAYREHNVKFHPHHEKQYLE